jgi:hypothetical protein
MREYDAASVPWHMHILVRKDFSCSLQRASWSELYWNIHGEDQSGVAKEVIVRHRRECALFSLQMWCRDRLSFVQDCVQFVC